jgi:hypothetical protein
MVIINPKESCNNKKFVDFKDLKQINVQNARLFMSYKNNIIVVHDEELMFVDTMTHELNFRLSYKNQLKTINAALVFQNSMILATEKGLLNLNLGAYNLNSEELQLICEGRFYKIE